MIIFLKFFFKLLDSIIYIRLDENDRKKFENVFVDLYGYGMDDKCLQLAEKDLLNPESFFM